MGNEWGLNPPESAPVRLELKAGTLLDQAKRTVGCQDGCSAQQQHEYSDCGRKCLGPYRHRSQDCGAEDQNADSSHRSFVIPAPRSHSAVDQEPGHERSGRNDISRYRDRQVQEPRLEIDFAWAGYGDKRCEGQARIEGGRAADWGLQAHVSVRSVPAVLGLRE